MPQAGGNVPFEVDKYKCLMIRKRVCEAVRKTCEQQCYEAKDRAQAKTRCKTACATCQTQQVCTQVIGMGDPISRRLNGMPSRPSERDEVIFKMVSILVRQEGFTKSDAIDRVASSGGCGVNRDEILNSVERVWQYGVARAKRLRLKMPDAKSYWRPGLLRYKE